jgi:hypothetical protein
VGCPGKGVPAPILPFQRTGPGKALDGAPEFDLTRFRPEFFDRLRRRVRTAGERGIFVSIMLFEVYGFMDREGRYPESLWAGNVFHGPNNCNGIDVDENGDRHGLEFFHAPDERVVRIQREYVRRVVDSVKDLDNVFFEVANELEARDWQYDMIRWIRRIERSRPRKHLVYMSPGGRNQRGRWSLLPRKDLVEGPADVFAVSRGWSGAYRGDPPVDHGGKPVFLDMDHVAAVDRNGDNDWNNNPVTPWKLVLRGYHQCLYDHDFWKPGSNREAWDTTRFNLGATVEYTEKMDLVHCRPRNDLASSGYCLASPGKEYLVLKPGGGKLEVKGLVAGREYRLQWYRITAHRVTDRGSVTPRKASHEFQAPYENAVLFLRADRRAPGAVDEDRAEAGDDRRCRGGSVRC